MGISNKQNEFGILTFGDSQEQARRQEMIQQLKQCPIPDSELLLNIGFFLTPQTLSRVLFMDFLYRQIIDLQGVVIEFGCRWGQSLSLFTALRGIYEPFNRLRKIIGFDTFEGLSQTLSQDGMDVKTGDYSVTPQYENYLQRHLELQEQESPMSHIKRFEVVKGDASVNIFEYLKNNPETIISMAYFDMDIYGPTRDCLKAILPHLTRGSIIGFDEVNDHSTPGETVALREVLGTNKVSVRRFPHNSRSSYIIYDGEGL